jgi:hypothetical protein
MLVRRVAETRLKRGRAALEARKTEAPSRPVYDTDRTRWTVSSTISFWLGAFLLYHGCSVLSIAASGYGIAFTLDRPF